MDDSRNQSVFERFLGRHPEVTVAVFLDFIYRLSGFNGDEVVDFLTDFKKLESFDTDVLELTAGPAAWLVQEEASIRKA